MDGWLREPRDQDRDQSWNCQAGLPGWRQATEPSEGAAWPLLAGRLPPQHVRDRCRAGAVPKPKARAPVIPPRDCVFLSELSSPWSCATLPTPRHAWNCQPAMTTGGLMTDAKHQAGINTTINQQQLQDRPKLWGLDLLAIRLGSQTKIQDQVQILRKFPLAACDRTNGPPLGPLFSFSALLSSFVFSALSALGWVASGPLELNRPP